MQYIRKIAVFPIFCYILHKKFNSPYAYLHLIAACVPVAFNYLLCRPYQDEFIIMLGVGCALSFGYLSYLNNVKFGIETAAIYAFMYWAIQDNGVLMGLPRLTFYNCFWIASLLFTAMTLEHEIPFA